MKLTRQQRVALKSVYDRPREPQFDQYRRQSYRAFRKTVQPVIMSDCIMVHWCGMWLGIETDGYTHS